MKVNLSGGIGDGLLSPVYALILYVSWLGGIVLAQGFWQVTFALIPFYSWYLVVEKAMMMFGIS